MILTLAAKSLRNRRLTATLTVLSIALAVALLLGVERIRNASREAFASTVSGTDLVVGARTSPAHLLLFAVFHIGNPNNNVRWDSFRAVAARPDVAWTIPLSLGDSHRGFRVLGTSGDYFDHLRYARDRALVFAQGTRFDDAHGAVIGADVAQSLHYAPGRQIVLAHGTGEVETSLHKEHPFRVVGILERTGTPVDRTIHVALEGLDLVHADGGGASPDPLAAALAARAARTADPHERTISAFLIGLKARGSALSVQRAVNEYAGEPLTAILPGVTLLEVWEIAGVAERALRAVSILVVAVGLAGMLVALLTSLNERRREMAVLRSVGARPAQIFVLILGEAMLLASAGVVLGLVVLEVALGAGAPSVQAHLGIAIDATWPTREEFSVMLLVIVAAGLASVWPAWRSYQFSLIDGMTLRV